MKINNQISNYFVSQSRADKPPKVYRAPVTMSANTAKYILNQSLHENIASTMLHVCLDIDSGIVYIPNALEFHEDQRQYLLNLALSRISKEYNGFSPRDPIYGSPFSSLRIRPLTSFTYACHSIMEHSHGHLEDIMIIEANLSKMPTTVKSLPEIYQKHKDFTGGYISTPVQFIDEIDNYGKPKSKELILEQNDPFILINIAPEAKPSATDKEWVVLSAYRDFLFEKYKDSIVCDDVNACADLFAIKRYLYMGWSFEELSSFFLDSITNFLELINAINLMRKSANALEEEGYKNPTSNHYYMTGKIDTDTFALKFKILEDGHIDPFRQIPYFEIIDYNPTTKYIIIKTPVFLSEHICQNILRMHTPPMIVRYNEALNTIDVKTPKCTYTSLLNNSEQIKKIASLVQFDVKANVKIEFRMEDGANGVSLANPDIFNTRKISDYLYAYNFISNMCKCRNVKFKDLDVVVGPIENLFGRGTQGGFINEKQFIEKKLSIPHKITKGFYIRPPLMMINTATMPSYADQTKTIIHEYSHYLFSQTDPEHEQEYDPKKLGKSQGVDNFIQWDKYFGDVDEILAHTTEIKFALMTGESVDEILRDKVGGQITAENYAIALRFREIVQKAIDELEQEQINEFTK